MTIFINRKEELRSLEEWSKKGRIALITGRRRVGKSRLILEFIKGKKAIYLLGADKGIEYNLRRFSEDISRAFDSPGLRFRDFEEMFEFLERRDIDIIVLDEFGYIVKAGGSEEFQRIADTVLRRRKLILSGSSVSLMEPRLVGYRSPLYGRVDMLKWILPLRFSHLFEWFPGIKAEDAVMLYSSTNGIPRYLEFFDGKNVRKEIKERMFNPDMLLFRDAKLMLDEELPEPARYLLIMESIAQGKNKMSEISSNSRIDINQIPYYLNVLRNLMFVKHEKPIFEKKRGIHKIADNYMLFWFRFISPFFEEIESGLGQNALGNFEKTFDSFVGHVFEDVCKEIIIRTGTFDYPQVRRWWHKDKEIDIVGLDEQTKDMLFCECKWQDRVNPNRIIKELKDKASLVKWQNEKRKEQYAIFAKSFRSRDVPEGVMLFDLKDMERVFKKG